MWGWGTNPRVRARRQAIPTSAANTFWAPYRYHLSSVTTHTTLFFQPPSRGFSYEVSMADTEIEEDSLDREGPESNRQSTSDLLEAPKQRPAHRQRLKRKSSTVTSGTRLFVEGNSTSLGRGAIAISLQPARHRRIKLNHVRGRVRHSGRAPKRLSAAGQSARTHRSACLRAGTSSPRCAAISA
jgi:hypothetical protein